MYSRNLIHPRVYENTPQLHSKVQYSTVLVVGEALPNV